MNVGRRRFLIKAFRGSLLLPVAASAQSIINPYRFVTPPAPTGPFWVPRLEPWSLTRKPMPGEAILDRSHPLMRGLVGWWLMNEGGGLTVRDWSGYGRHGTMTLMDATNDWVIDRVGHCLDFDGSDDRVAVAAIDNTSGFSVGGWMKITGVLTSDQRAISSNAAAAGDWNHVLWMDTGGSGDGWAFAVFGSGGNTAAGENTANAALNTWQHVFGTWDGNNVTVYVDGKLTATASGQTTIFSPTDFAIGEFTYNGQNFQGRIDDVRYYNRALNASEIASLYQRPYQMFLTQHT